MHCSSQYAPLVSVDRLNRTKIIRFKSVNSSAIILIINITKDLNYTYEKLKNHKISQKSNKQNFLKTSTKSQVVLNKNS